MSIVFFDSEVVKTIKQEVEQFPQVECAGLLLGKIEEDGLTYRVLRSCGSGPKARHGYASISPDVDFLNQVIMKAEMENLEFLGEWHKHPGSLDSPSSGDVTTITEIINDSKLDQYLAAIVTTKQDRIQINTYLFDNSSSYKRIPWARTPTESLITPSEKITIEPGNEQKGLFEEHIKEEKEMQTQVKHGVFHWLSKLLSGSDAYSKEMLKVFSRRKWYEKVVGKKQLSLEKHMMAEIFPSFTLFKKKDDVFWKGSYKNHTIILKYPHNYPNEPLRVFIEPNVAKIPKENASYYATLAVQTAFLRIENSMPLKTVSVPTSGLSMLQNVAPWYETAAGKACLLKEQKLLTLDFLNFNLFKLSDGKLAFDVKLNDSFSIVVICPEDYPNYPPTVKVSRKKGDVQFDINAFNRRISKGWGESFKSVDSIVREIMYSSSFKF